MNDLDRLNVVVANAGILPMNRGDPDPLDFVGAVDVDLIGVMMRSQPLSPPGPDGASIIITGSTAGRCRARQTTQRWVPGAQATGGPTGSSYVEEMGLHLAPRFIRSTQCTRPTADTRLLHNDGLYSVLRPDLADPVRDDVLPAFTYFQAMPIPYVEPVDISNLVPSWPPMSLATSPASRTGSMPVTSRVS